MPHNPIDFMSVKIHREARADIGRLLPGRSLPCALNILVDFWKTAHSDSGQPQPVEDGSQAQAHLEACPLRSFTPEDLRKYPLTLAKPPEEPLQLGEQVSL